MFGTVVSLKAYEYANTFFREKLPDGPQKDAIVKSFDEHKEGGSRAAFNLEMADLEWFREQFDALAPTIDPAFARIMTTFRSDMDKPVDLDNRKVRAPRDPNAPKPERRARGGGRRTAGVPPTQFKAKEAPWFPLAEPAEGQMIVQLDFELPAKAEGVARQFSGYFLEGKLVRLRAYHLSHDQNYSYDEAISPGTDTDLVQAAEDLEEWFAANIASGSDATASAAAEPETEAEGAETEAEQVAAEV